MVKITPEARRVLDICAMGDIAMSCGKCGHVDNLMAFGRSPLGMDLPRGTYQCPACRRAIERRSKGCQIIRLANGEPFGVPERIEIHSVPSYL